MVEKLVNSCWRQFKRGLLLALLAIALVGGFLYLRADEEIRKHVEAMLAKAYPALDVRVRHAQFLKGEGFLIRGISISERGADGPRAELLSVDELFLKCNPDLDDLLHARLDITHIKISRPALHATRRAGGGWSVEKLLPLPKFSAKSPEGEIEGATVEIFDPLKNPSSTLVLRDIHLKWTPTEAHGPRGSRKQGPMNVEGYMAADHVQRVVLHGTVDKEEKTCQLNGHVEGLDISPELRAAMPSDLSDKLTAIGSLRAEANLDFTVARASAQGPITFDVNGRLVRGRFDDPRLPYIWNDLRAQIHANEKGFAIVDLTASHGASSIKLSCRHEGYSPNSPMYLEAIANGLAIDNTMASSLPEPLKKHWNEYQPRGIIDADLKLSFDGVVWRPEVTVDCIDGAFTYHKFPYPFERATGRITLKNDVLSTEKFVAFAGSQPVRFDVRIEHPGPRWTGTVETHGENVPFDEKLFAAIARIKGPEKTAAGAPTATANGNVKAADVIRSLNPRGTFNFHCRSGRDDPQQAMPYRRMNVTLNRCSVNYDKFAYPISNIRGTIEMVDDSWTFRDLEGSNDAGMITCEGSLRPAPEGTRLSLFFTGDNVPLEEELRDALPPNTRTLWSMIRPRGAVNITAQVDYVSGSKRPSIDLKAWPQSDRRQQAKIGAGLVQASTAPGQKVSYDRPTSDYAETSIEPTCFPYRLEISRGTLHYHDGHVDLEGIRASHGRVTMSAGGGCDIGADGAWRMALKGINVNRVRADHDLMAALPEGLKRGIAELRPDSAVDLRGDIEFSRGGQPDAPLESRWNMLVNMHKMAIDCGVRLTDMYGAVQLYGTSRGGKFSSNGELQLDSVVYKNYQLHDARGPLYLDNAVARFGSPPDKNGQSRNGRHVSAQIFDGVLNGDCEVSLGAPAQYTLRARLDNADLTQFAKEHLVGRQQLNGRVDASVVFTGDSHGAHTLRGAGDATLRDANIYELPMMISMLKLLSVRLPDSTAFTTSDVHYRIQGEHLIMDKVNFHGDAISLDGQGQLDLAGNIDLTFHAMVGRNNWRVPVLSNMMGEASQQIMQIKVAGTIDNPDMRREVLPGVNQAIQELQTDLQPLQRSQSPQSRGLMRSLWPFGG